MLAHFRTSIALKSAFLSRIFPNFYVTCSHAQPFDNSGGGYETG